MRDIRLSLGFLDHYKTKRLQAALGADAVLSLIRLWCWTSENRSKGELTAIDDEAIEIISGWQGESTAFLTHLVKVGFLKKGRHHYRVHDWAEHQGFAYYAKERSQKARRAAEARYQKPCEPEPVEIADEEPLLLACSEHAPNPTPIEAFVFDESGSEIDVTHTNQPRESTYVRTVRSPLAEETWKVGGRGGSKKQFMALWDYHLPRYTPDQLLDAIKAYRIHCDVRGVFKKNLTTFFNRPADHFPEWVYGCPECEGPECEAPTRKILSSAENIAMLAVKAEKERDNGRNRSVENDSKAFMLLPD